MTTQDWHVPDGLLARYAAGPADALVDQAVEAHLMRCGTCRHGLATLAQDDDLDDVWRGIHRAVRAPAPGHLVRGLRRLGVPEADIVVVRASTGLYLPWAVAVGAALVAVIVSGVLAGAVGSGLDDLAFLLIAPLIPVLTVAAAFDGVDPLRELTAGTPISKLRVALLRTVAALAVALPLTGAVGLLLPGLDGMAAVWLVPGLALCALTLVLLTWLAAWTAAGASMLAWLVVAVALARGGPATGAAALASTTTQLASGALAVACAVVLLLRGMTQRPLGGAR